MQNNNNIKDKESFKLLQLSDDSKSLTDLELPEILNQRKRKVRRKTRPKNIQYSRQNQDAVAGGVDQSCKNIKLWVAIFLTCGWLFILTYLAAVMQSENRGLEVQVSKLMATSQIVPDALQKWHETSKTLEQNQTAIYSKIMDIQQRLDNFENELTQIKELIKTKNENSENTKILNLEKNVADFGASIKDIKVDVDKLKDNFQKLQESEIVNKNNLDNLTILFETVVNNTSSITPLTIFNNNNDTHELINNLNKTLINDIKNLSTQLFNVNDTLSQKIKGLDDDLYKNKVDKLIDDYANMSSHVTTIENDWSTYKQKSMNFEQSYETLNSEISNLKNYTKIMASDVYDLKIGKNNLNKDPIIPTQLPSAPVKQNNNNNNNDDNKNFENKSKPIDSIFEESPELLKNSSSQQTSIINDSIIASNGNPISNNKTTTTEQLQIMNLTLLNNNNNNNNNNTISQGGGGNGDDQKNNSSLTSANNTITTPTTTTTTTSTTIATTTTTELNAGSKPKLLSIQKI